MTFCRRRKKSPFSGSREFSNSSPEFGAKNGVDANLMCFSWPRWSTTRGAARATQRQRESHEASVLCFFCTLSGVVLAHGDLLAVTLPRVNVDSVAHSFWPRRPRDQPPVGVQRRRRVAGRQRARTQGATSRRGPERRVASGRLASLDRRQLTPGASGTLSWPERGQRATGNVSSPQSTYRIEPARDWTDRLDC